MPATIIPDLLVEHCEELEFLWSQRANALLSTGMTLRDLLRFEERIAAHIEGLMVGGEATIPVVREGLAAGQSSVAFASAFTLLHLNSEPAAKLVAAVLPLAEGPALDGIGDALCHAPQHLVRAALRTTVAEGRPLNALTAAVALAAQGQPAIDSERVMNWAGHELPKVRMAAWRAIKFAGISCQPAVFDRGFQDSEPDVRCAAFDAAAWARHPDLLRVLRSRLAEPAAHWDAVLIFASVAGPEDAPRLAALGGRADLGTRRFELLGTLGHPSVFELLLPAVESPDPRTAAAAGAAFTRLTGRDVESDRRVALPPEAGREPDAFEREFPEEARLPDPARVRECWRELAGIIPAGARWCRGVDLGDGRDPGQWDLLDLRSRYEAARRARFRGFWNGSPASVGAFPRRQWSS
jgi:uncharacterized protein (TIGR02270 family)